MVATPQHRRATRGHDEPTTHHRNAGPSLSNKPATLRSAQHGAAEKLQPNTNTDRRALRDDQGGQLAHHP